MKLSQIKANIERDLVIDPAELDVASLRIPQIHNKYLNYLRDESLLMKKHRIDYKTLYRLKWEYYLGKSDQETLELYNWEPFQLHILKQDVDKYLDSDHDLNKLRAKMDICEEKIKYLEEIMKNITNIQWNIKNAIEWKKFVNGQ